MKEKIGFAVVLLATIPLTVRSQSSSDTATSALTSIANAASAVGRRIVTASVDQQVADVRADANLLQGRIANGAPVSPIYARSLAIDAQALQEAGSMPAAERDAIVENVRLDLRLKAQHAQAMSDSNTVGNDLRVAISTMHAGVERTGVEIFGNACAIPNMDPPIVSGISRASIDMAVGCYALWTVSKGVASPKQLRNIGPSDSVSIDVP